MKTCVLFWTALFLCLLPEDVAGSLPACLAACARGTTAIQAFCRTIPAPQVRAPCWAVQFAGPAACNGFCYLYF